MRRRPARGGFVDEGAQVAPAVREEFYVLVERIFE